MTAYRVIIIPRRNSRHLSSNNFLSTKTDYSSLGKYFSITRSQELAYLRPRAIWARNIRAPYQIGGLCFRRCEHATSVPGIRACSASKLGHLCTVSVSSESKFGDWIKTFKKNPHSTFIYLFCLLDDVCLEGSLEETDFYLLNASMKLSNKRVPACLPDNGNVRIGWGVRRRCFLTGMSQLFTNIGSREVSQPCLIKYRHQHIS